MWIKTAEYGRKNSKYLSNVRIEKDKYGIGTGFFIIATSEKYPYEIILKRCLTQEKAEKQLKIYKTKLGARGIQMAGKDKKVIEKLNAACQGIADLDYIAYNLKSYKAIAHFIASILVYSASRFGITPEEFLKAVEEDFQSELE